VLGTLHLGGFNHSGMFSPTMTRTT
jgi:hypothetical protein